MNINKHRAYAPETVLELGIVNDLGDTVPVDGTTGFAKSCIFQHIAGAGLSLLYVNAGNIDSCDFVLDVISPNELGSQPTLKIGCLGDSISINTVITPTNWASDSFHYLPRVEFELDARVEVDPTLVFATAGNTIPEVIADDLPGAVASDADVIVVLAGVNLDGVTTAMATAGIETIRDQLVDSGKTVILCTLCPSVGRDPDEIVKMFELNSFILNYASSKENTYCANFSEVLAGQKTAITDDLNWGALNNHVIDAVSTGSKTFTISDDGDLTNIFPVGETLSVSGSTGNDGTYTVASTSWGSPNFVITVNETVSSAVADGTIHTGHYNRDGGTNNSHPSIAGYWVMADELVRVISDFPNLPPHSRPPYNDTRHIDNPLFLGTAGTIGGAGSGDLADSLTSGGDDAGTTFSKVARGSGIKSDSLPGAWQQIDVDTGDTNVVLTDTIRDLESGVEEVFDMYVEVSIKSDAVTQGTPSSSLRVTGGGAITTSSVMLIDDSAAGRSGVLRLRFFTDGSSTIATAELRPFNFIGITQYGAIWFKKVE